MFCDLKFVTLVGLLFPLTCIAAQSSQEPVSTLYSFSQANRHYANADGAHPAAAILQLADDSFIGTAQSGGTAGEGTVFEYTISGSVLTLHSFSKLNPHGLNSDGAAPQAPLILASDGNLYGTTSSGGAGGGGTVFMISTQGKFVTLHSFAGKADGAVPTAGLIETAEGIFYGTTSQGGASGGGTVFTMNSSGAVTTLHSFSTLDSSGDNADGFQSFAGLVEAGHGSLYGVTALGGANGQGAIFKITSSGVFSTLHSFSTDNDQGTHPVAALIHASNGNFYGTARDGGQHGMGIIYRITSSGAFKAMYSFSGVDGSNPEAPLDQARDGDLYGTTTFGGDSGNGTVFKVSTPGAFQSLYSFTGNGSDGVYPNAAVIQASDGNFYGTTFAWGTFGTGIIYKLIAN